jgi:hypothetical protein
MEDEACWLALLALDLMKDWVLRPVVLVVEGMKS